MAGTLIVDQRNLTIGNDGYSLDSAVSGLLKIDGGTGSAKARLKISGDHTIVGEGGAIELTYVPETQGENPRALIVEANDGYDRLTLDNACSGTASRDCGLSVTGLGGIEVQLDNRAFVVADYDAWYDRLWLINRPKTSTAKGYWVCENGGTMSIETSVTGCGDWLTVDVDCTSPCTSARGISCNGTFHIPWQSNGCVSGTGDVTLRAGCGGTDDHQLKVEDNQFCTTGRLIWQSVEGDGGRESFISKPAIRVHNNAVVQFNYSALACPSCGE